MKSLQCMGNTHTIVEVYDGDPNVAEIVKENVKIQENSNRDDAFFVVDLGEISRKVAQWKQMMPRISPFYAIKCNADPDITRFIADMGLGFDCASKREIEQILDLGVDPSRIVYANPCKQATHLRYAARHNVDLMTFDSVYELHKIKKYCPSARLLLRIHSSKEYKAVHNFDKKFGCHPNAAKSILVQAKKLGLSIVGLSFHVGSLPEEVACFASVIEDAHGVFAVAEDLGFSMGLLDIGGGYPGQDSDTMTFAKVANVINTALDKFFPPSRGIRIIAEPGRYFVTSAFTLVVNIIAKRVWNKARDTPTQIYPDMEELSEVTPSIENGVSRLEDVESQSQVEPSAHRTTDEADIDGDDDDNDDDNLTVMYYVNDGIYGAFNNVFTDHAIVFPKLVRKAKSEVELKSMIWGPTCDGLDCVMEDCRLPDLDVGTWLYFHDMGAYTVSLSCDFNGISRPNRLYVCSNKYWKDVYPQQELSARNETSHGDSGIMATPAQMAKSEAKVESHRRNISYRLSLNKGE